MEEGNWKVGELETSGCNFCDWALGEAHQNKVGVYMILQLFDIKELLHIKMSSVPLNSILEFVVTR